MVLDLFHEVRKRSLGRIDGKALIGFRYQGGRALPLGTELAKHGTERLLAQEFLCIADAEKQIGRAHV